MAKPAKDIQTPEITERADRPKQFHRHNPLLELKAIHPKLKGNTPLADLNATNRPNPLLPIIPQSDNSQPPAGQY